MLLILHVHLFHSGPHFALHRLIYGESMLGLRKFDLVNKFSNVGKIQFRVLRKFFFARLTKIIVELRTNHLGQSSTAQLICQLIIIYDHAM